MIVDDFQPFKVHGQCSTAQCNYCAILKTHMCELRRLAFLRTRAFRPLQRLCVRLNHCEEVHVESQLQNRCNKNCKSIVSKKCQKVQNEKIDPTTAAIVRASSSTSTHYVHDPPSVPRIAVCAFRLRHARCTPARYPA